MPIKIETHPITTLSSRHLSASTRRLFRGAPSTWPAAGYDGFHTMLIYAHDENSGDPPIPDDLWTILQQARRARIEYVLFDDQAEPVAGLPVYADGSDDPDGLPVRSIDVGDLFFAGQAGDVDMVCVMESFDDDALYAHVYNLDVSAKFSRLSGRLLGLCEYGGAERNYELRPRAERLVQLEWGQERTSIRLIGDPDFDFGDADQSEAALEWARRELTRIAPGLPPDDTPSP
jgi:hypothetical protein